MAVSLFGATPTVGSPDNAEDTYSFGTRVTFAVAGSIVGVRFWGASNAISTSPSGAVYTTAGVQQSVTAFSGFTTSAWNTVTLGTPVTVTAGQTWDIVVGPLNRYAANSSTFPLTNGDLTGTHGRFVVGTSLAWPTTNGGGGTGSTWYGVDVLFEPDAGGTPVGAASETSTAQPLAATKTRATGVATTTDTAQPLIAAKQRPAGAATAVDTAQPVAVTKTRAIGAATVVEAAQPVTATKTVTVGVAATVDAAQPVAAATGWTVNPATTVDTAQPVTATKTRAVGVATVADTALTLVAVKGRTVGVATTVDTAQPVVATKTRAVGPATETSTALPLIRAGVVYPPARITTTAGVRHVTTSSR